MEDDQLKRRRFEERQEYFRRQKQQINEFKTFKEQTEGMLNIKKKRPSKVQMREYQQNLQRALAQNDYNMYQMNGNQMEPNGGKFKHNPYQQAMDENEEEDDQYHRQRETLQPDDEDGDISHEHTHTESDDEAGSKVQSAPQVNTKNQKTGDQESKDLISQNNRQKSVQGKPLTEQTPVDQERSQNKQESNYSKEW